ncbi:MerC domain-containing protein [Winogradskyella poriferorum]|uniref:MerC domain-containing protein n=1 Tax=Winogradskyella poriferorum TaxID=307627 RepID=UPI003D659FF9
MITKTIQQSKSDTLGVLASGLCLVHCIATPFIFLAQTGSATIGSSAPAWWGFIDIILVLISFYAVYWSANSSTNKWVKNGLWINWVGLCLIILNEKIHLLAIPEFAIYIPAIALIVLHLYNKK